MSDEPLIGFAGLSHLGLVSAAAAADKGYPVVAFDPKHRLIEQIEQGILPISEPGLPAVIAANRGRLTLTAEARKLSRCDVVFIALDVPTDSGGRSEVAAVDRLLETVEPLLQPRTTLVILSQVPPGFTRRRQSSGPLFYQVETLIFGQALERALRPERFIVGCADPRAPLPEAYSRFLESFGCPILPMRYESAELAKISINLYLVGSITVANTLAEVCERTGADWSEIVPALRLDARIGPQAYLAPGLGLGGGNLERDLITLRGIAAEIGAEAGVVDAWLTNSRHRRGWGLSLLNRALPGKPGDTVIAVLGLAYKAGTASTRNAPALALIGGLEGRTLRLYDPAVTEPDIGRPDAVLCDTPLEACNGADAVAVMTAWPEFAALDPVELATAMRGRVVLDPFGVLDAGRCAAAGLDHHVLGRAVVPQTGE